jgi:hypothetical protein
MVSLEFFIDMIRQHYGPGVFPGGKCGVCVRLKNLPPPFAVVKKSGNLKFLEPSGSLQTCNGTALLFNADTVISAPDDEWSYHSKHVEQFTNINKMYIVESCLIIIDGDRNIPKTTITVHLIIRHCVPGDSKCHIIKRFIGKLQRAIRRAKIWFWQLFQSGVPSSIPGHST